VPDALEILGVNPDSTKSPDALQILGAESQDKLLPGPRWVGGSPVPNKNQLEEMALGAIPSVGGAIGGGIGALAGPATAIYGAGAGGTAGRAVELGLRKLLGRQLPDMPEGTFGSRGAASKALGVASDLGGQGFQQSLAEGVGMGGQVLSRAVAKNVLMKSAILPSKAINQSFKNVAQTALDEGVLPGTVKLGSKRTAELVGASAQAQRALIDAAKQGGVFHTVENIAQPMIDDAEKTLGRPLLPMERARVIARTRGIISDALSEKTHGALKPSLVATSALAPDETQIVKQFAQDKANDLLKAKSQGNLSAAGSANDYLAVAQSTRKALTSIQLPDPTGKFPTLGDAIASRDAQTKRLMGLNRAMSQREAEDRAPLYQRLIVRGSPAAAGAAVGYETGQGTPGERLGRTASGALLGAGLAHPLTLGVLAHVLNNPALLAAVRQTPRAMLAAHKQ
jgi:hypothetical protein